MKRELINQLIQWVELPGRKPLILRGARQIGKSTAVRMLAQATGRKLVEINLERNVALDSIFATYDLKKIISAIEAVTRTSLPDDNSLLFLDEIQATPSAISALRYFYEDRPNLAVIAAGSLLEQVLGQKPLEIPVGRIQYLYAGPLSFEEFVGTKGEGYFLDRIRNFEFGHEWPEALHAHGLELVKEFLLVGGMPGALHQYLTHSDGGNLASLALQSIIDTFKDDFAKYSSRQILIPVLQQVYDQAPRKLAKLLIYKEIVPNVRHEYIKDAVNLLASARVMTLAKQNDCNGIPIAAGRREKSPKLFWLDVALVNRMLNLDSSWLTSDINLIHAGPIAEQFIAQHLFYWHGSFVPPSLNYWSRDGKSASAEVDFAVQYEGAIIPIEVKSGASGSLRSLHQYLATKSPPFGIRFDGGLPHVMPIDHQVRINEKNSIQLKARVASLPIYMVGQLKRILAKM